MTYKEFIDAWNKHDHTGAWTCWIRMNGIGNKKNMVLYDQEARDTSLRTRYDSKRWWFPIYGSHAVWMLADQGDELGDYYYKGYFKVDHGDIVARLGDGYRPDKDDAVYTGDDLADMKPHIMSTVWNTLMTFKKEFKQHDSI